MTSEARFLVNASVITVVDGLLLGACLFAWIKGRPAERLGATVYFVSALISIGLAVAGGKLDQIVSELLFDALVAVGFLVLAIRYNSLWLGAAMMLKGVQLALHATHLTDEADMHLGAFNVYALSLDVVSVLISLTIIGGTAASIRGRRRDIIEPDLGAARAPNVAAH